MIMRKLFSLFRRSVILIRGTANRPGRDFKKDEVGMHMEGKVNVNNRAKYSNFSL